MNFAFIPIRSVVKSLDFIVTSIGIVSLVEVGFVTTKLVPTDAEDIKPGTKSVSVIALFLSIKYKVISRSNGNPFLARR